MTSRPYAMRRRKRIRASGLPVVPVVIGVLVLLSIVLFLYNFVWSAGSYQARKIVSEFYELEQAGNYGGAWELFHPAMQDKYPKDQYIQHRAQVYMQLLGAETFRYEIDGTGKLRTWSMDGASPPLGDVYRLTVTQRLMSVFGQIAITQEVYVVKEGGEWKLLWSFQVA